MLLDRLARWCYRRRRSVLGLWILAFVVMGALGSALNGGFGTDFRIPGAESTKVQNLLNDRFPERKGDNINVVFKADRGVDDPAVQQAVTALLAKYRTVEHVEGIDSPYDPAVRGQISNDRKIAYASVRLDVQGADMPVKTTKKMIKDAKAASDGGSAKDVGTGSAPVQVQGLHFALGGQAVMGAEFQPGGSEEGAGILAAVIILLITFGSVLAMGLPILTAIMGIGIGLAIVELLANVVIVPNFAPIVAAMVGIGVGIDYALLIVTRYRQALHTGLEPEDAVAQSITTAGRSVLFAGTTVVISVMGMLVMNLPFLVGVALGAGFAVLVTMIGSVTLLPAMLGFAGKNIDKLRVPFVPPDSGDHRSGFWFRWSRMIQRRPAIFGIIGLVIVLVLAAPFLSMKLGFPSEKTVSSERQTRQSFDLMSQGFGEGFNAPLVLATELPTPAAVGDLTVLQGRLWSVPDVAFVTPPAANQAGDTAVMVVFPKEGATADSTKALVNRLRHEVLPREEAALATPLKVKVGGPNAAFIDQDKVVANRLPVFIGVVVGLSFLLLMVVFRSLLVALKAAVMNLLSIGAAYGVLVAVAQWGWCRELFGISAASPIVNWLPMMMFAILFGLSMDYEVFLLSRIREEYVRNHDNGVAVADGLAMTARVITAAAAIMVAVFIAFVLGPEIPIKQLGLGFAVAVFIDATLIRMVLVPSTMELLGDANWWLPRWLDRLLPHINVDQPATEPQVDRELEPALN